MYPFTRKRLDPTQPLYAVRVFTWNDRTINVGDVFSTHGVAEHRVTELWGMRYIDHENIAAPIVQPVPAERPAKGAKEKKP